MMLEEVKFKKGKSINLPQDKNPSTFYVLEDTKTIHLGEMVLQDTNDVQTKLMGVIEAKEIATTKKIDAIVDSMVDISALTRVEEMIPVKTSQLTNDSGFITIKDIPSDLTEYVTEEELEAKGYLTEHQDISGKQDVIEDLEIIRSGATLGATALQSIPSEYATTNYVDNKVSALINGAPETLDTLDELAAALKDNKDIVSVLENSIGSKQDKIDDLETIRTNASNAVSVDEFLLLSELVDSKADASVLSGYSTTNHNHNEKYYTKEQVDEMWAWLILDDAVSTPSISSDNTIILPDDSESGVYTFKYEDINETPIENYDDIGKLTI